MAKNMEIAFLVDFYGDMLTEKQRDMIELYYDDDLSLSEIAENEGITRQGVRDSTKRAESQLLEMEDRLGLAKRFRTVRESIEAIRRAASEIRQMNGQAGSVREFYERAEHILSLAEMVAE